MQTVKLEAKPTPPKEEEEEEEPIDENDPYWQVSRHQPLGSLNGS